MRPPLFGMAALPPPPCLFAELTEKQRRLGVNGGDVVKTCRHCGEEKSVGEFPRARRMLDGRSSWCRACHLEASRRTRAKQRELIAEALEARRLVDVERLREQARRGRS